MVLDHRSCLIVFSGMPGTEEAVVSERLALRLCAVHLRTDILDQATEAVGGRTGGPAGDVAATALAEANLQFGVSVVTHCSDPVGASRLSWSRVADRRGVALIEIHLVCSDVAKPRRRTMSWTSSLSSLLGYEAVSHQVSEPGNETFLLLDTSAASPDQLVDLCHAFVIGRLEGP
jgi:hypothetical protein